MRKITTMIALVALTTGAIAATVQTEKVEFVAQVATSEDTKRVVQTNRHLSATDRLIPAVL